MERNQNSKQNVLNFEEGFFPFNQHNSKKMKRKDSTLEAPRKKVWGFKRTWSQILASPKHVQEVCASHSPRAVDALFKAMLGKDTPRAVFDELETLGLFKDEYAVHQARAALKEDDLGRLSTALKKIPRCAMYRLLRESFGNDPTSALIIGHMKSKGWSIGLVNVDMISRSSMMNSIVASTTDERFTSFHIKMFYDVHRRHALKTLFERVDVSTMIRLGSCFLSLLMMKAQDMGEIIQHALQRSGERRSEFITSLVYPKEQCVPLPTTRAMLMGLDGVLMTLIDLFNEHGIKWGRRDKEHGNRTPSLVAVMCATKRYISVNTARRVIFGGGGSLYKDDNLNINAFGYVATLKAPVDVLELVFNAHRPYSMDRHIRFTAHRDIGPYNSSLAVCLAESDYPFSYLVYDNDLATRISDAVKYMARMPLFEKSIERRHHSGLLPVQLMALNFKQVLPELKSASSSWSTVLYNLMIVKSNRVPLGFTLEHMRRGVAYLLSEGHVTREEVAGMASATMVPFWEPSWGQAPVYGLDDSVRQLGEIECAPQWTAILCLKLAGRFPLEAVVSALKRHFPRVKYNRIKRARVSRVLQHVPLELGQGHHGPGFPRGRPCLGHDRQLRVLWGSQAPLQSERRRVCQNCTESVPACAGGAAVLPHIRRKSIVFCIFFKY